MKKKEKNMKKPIINSELIKNYLEKNNITVTEFCKTCKLSKLTFFKILSNITLDYDIRYLYRIAKAMGCDICDIFVV